MARPCTLQEYIIKTILRKYRKHKKTLVVVDVDSGFFYFFEFGHVTHRTENSSELVVPGHV